MKSNAVYEVCKLLGVSVGKYGNTRGFLTYAEADDMAKKRGRIVVHILTGLDGGRYHFFSDNHLLGYVNEKNKIKAVPASITLPMSVVPREGLESGVVDSLEKYCLVFHNDSMLLESEENAVNFIAEDHLYVVD